MAKGKTKSKMGLKARRTEAAKLYAKGYSVASVARKLDVSLQTAYNYRDKYEASLREEAQENPGLLREVLNNTFRTLKELDLIREEAWKNLQPRKKIFHFNCAHCDEPNDVTVYVDPEDKDRTSYLNVLLKAQDQRAKLFGVIGVKADVLVAMAQIQVAQDKLIAWMTSNLEGEIREQLAEFLEGEFAKHLNRSEAMPPMLELSESDIISDTADVPAA